LILLDLQEADSRRVRRLRTGKMIQTTLFVKIYLTKID